MNVAQELSTILYVQLSFYRVIQKAALFSIKCSVNCSTLILQPFLIDAPKALGFTVIKCDILNRSIACAWS